MRRINFLFILILTITQISIANAQEWKTDFSEAKKMAQEKNRNIILVFSGSDWCAPCIKLEREIWKSEQFQTYAKDHFVLVRADFPRKRANKLSKEQEKKNAQLAEKYNTKGYFPLVLVMDKNTNVLGHVGYKNVSPEEYINILESFKP